MNSKDKVVAVVGPTGSGKTQLAVEIAKRWNGVIISADSRQVYRGLDVGTNKEGTTASWHGEPCRAIKEVPQLLVDIVSPGERFTLHDWLTEARRLVVKILATGQLPIVVGGTGLYVTALTEGYEPGGGRHAKEQRDPSFCHVTFQLEVERAVLNKRSDERFTRIFDELVRETQALMANGVSTEWLESIGLDYRFATYYLTRQMNRELAISQFQRESHNYIRRQLTWWRHHGSPVLVYSPGQANKLVGQFLDS